MQPESKSCNRLMELYRRLVWQMRAASRMAQRSLRARLPLRLHVELLPQRLMMSASASGSETLADTASGGAQAPAIAMNPAGSSVIVWGTGDSGGSVFGQRFNPSGSPVGTQFQINQVGAGGQSEPSVAMDDAGDFVVCWNSGGSSTYVRLINSSGNPITNPTLVTSNRVGNSLSPVAMNASGTFAVAWEGKGSTDNDGIYQQKFLASGYASGGVVLVNTTTAGSQTNPSLAMDSAGDEAIAWTDKSTPGATIKAACFSASGASVAEFTAGSVANQQVDDSDVAIDSTGAFVIAWQTNYAGANSWDVNERRFSASGSALDANPVVVNTQRTDTQQNPAVAVRPDGSYLIAWQSNHQDGDNQGVYAQLFTAAGATDGGEFRVNTTIQGDQQNPVAAWNGNSAIVAWEGNGVNESHGVFFQRYTTTGATNLAPVITSPASTQNTTKNTPVTFSAVNGNALSVSDSDANGGIEQISITSTNGTLTLGSTAGLIFSSGTGTGDTNAVFTGTVPNLNAALSGMTFTPAQNFTGNASLSLVTNDLGNTGSGGAKTASSSIPITVSAPPSVNTVPGAQTTNENSPLVFSPGNSNAIYIGSGWNYARLQTSAGTFTLSTTSGLSFGNGTSNGGSTIDFGGTVAAMNAALNSLRFSPSLNYVGQAQINLTTSSSGLLGLGLLGSSSLSSIPVSVTVPAAPANQAPVITTPLQQTTLENVDLRLSSPNLISVSDPDGGTNVEQITLTATSGTFSLSQTTNLTFLSGTGTADQTMTFTGTLNDINQALNNLNFSPAPSFFGAAGITVSVDDLGHAGTGGARVSTATIPVNVTEVNQPPTVSVPSMQNALENVPLVFSTSGGNAITVNDIDSNGAAERVSLSANNGTLSLATSAGLTFNSGSSSGQSSMTFTGTLDDINAALDGLVLTPANGYSGQAGVTIAINDLGNSGAGSSQSATSTVSAQFAQVNQAPTISAPAPQTADENVPLFFSSGGGNAISVSDADSGGASERVTLSVSHGALNLHGASHLTFANGTNSNGPTVDFSGTLADINTALDGLIYRPAPDYVGAVSLNITINDLGHTGLGGSLQAGQTVQLTVREVNQPPAISAPAPRNVGENSPLIFSSATGDPIVATDSDAFGAAEQITVSISNGTLNLSGTTGITFTNGTNNGSNLLTFAGTLASINSALNGLVFTPSQDFTGSTSLGLVIDDLGNTGVGGNSVFGTTVPLSVIPVRYPPSVTSTTTLENQQTTDGLVITPNALDGAANGYYQISNITNGSVYLADGITPVSNGQFITFAEGASGLRFTPAQDFAGTGSFTIQTSTSPSNAGRVAGSVTANITVTATATPPNTPPSVSSSGMPLSYTEGQAATAIDPALTVADADSASLVAATIRLVGYVSGEDALGFVDQNGIAGAWDASSGVLTLSGSATVAQYQAALRSVSYVNGSQNPSVASRSAEFAVSDGQAWSATATSAINVTAVNNAPVIIAPVPRTIAEDTPLVFSALNFNGLSLSDVDSNGSIEGVTLTADHGVITLSGTQGLSFISGTGTNDSSMSITGTLNDLNTALNGATFTPALYFSGDATIHVSISDGGNTGIGGNQTATASLPITITHVNHAPALPSATNLYLPPIAEGTSNPAGNTIADVLSASGPDPISDVDANSLQGIAVVGLDTGARGHWQFMLAGQNWRNFHAVSDRGATLLPIDALLRFVPDNGWSGTATLSVRAWDQTTGQPGESGVDTSVNGGSTAFSSTVVTAIVGVTHVASPPELTVNDGLLANDNNVSSITPEVLHARETDLSPDQLTFTLLATPRQGTLLIGNLPAMVGSTFAQSDIDAGRLAYVPAASQAADDSFTFVVSDVSGTSLPPAVFHIHVSASPVLPPLPPVVPLPQLPAIVPPTTVNVPLLVSPAASPNQQTYQLIPRAIAITDAPSTAAAGSSASQYPGLVTSTEPIAVAASPGIRPRLQAQPVVLVNAAGRPLAVPLSHAGLPAVLKASAPEQNSSVRPNNPNDLQVANLVSRGESLVLPQGELPANSSSGKLAVLGAGTHGPYAGPTNRSAASNRESPLWRDLDAMDEQIHSDHKVRIIAGSASLVSVGVSVMYFLWALRAGSILSSLLSSMPAWKLVDPLPILDQMASKTRGQRAEDEDDETLESMVEGSPA